MVHDKGEIKCMIELQKGSNVGCLVTGGDDFTFKLVSINVEKKGHQVLQTYLSSGPINTLVEINNGRIALS